MSKLNSSFRLLVLSVFILAQLSSFAASEAELGRTSVATLQKLRAQGIHYVGAVAVPTLEARFKNINWRVLPLFPTASGGSRMGAANVVEENVVILNQHVLKNTYGLGREIFILHEALGASGVDDEDYRGSLAIIALNQDTGASSSSRNFLLEQVRGLKSFDSNRIYQEAGGGTSVGGGGDGVATTLKWLLIQRSASYGARSHTLVRKIFKLNVMVDYRAESFEGPPPKRRWNKITVSYIQWITMPEYQEAVIQQLLKSWN